MRQLSSYNTLPPRPEYLRKIRSVLKENEEMTLKEIMSRTKLTKTQAECALKEMIERGEVAEFGKPWKYSLKMPGA